MAKKSSSSIKPTLNKGEENYHLIVVAGGSGTRMNSEIPKQFIELQGKPILMHTLKRFKKAIPGIHIVVVLPSNHIELWKSLCRLHQFDSTHEITEGGETRFHSVKNGLQLVPDSCVVGIHDAVRPLVSESTILNVFHVAEKKGNASPSIPLNESIREVKKTGNKAVDRNNYFIIQTPQCFQANQLKKAFGQDYLPSFTDDATVLESIGEKINLVEGNRENIKITTPHDLLIAEALIAKR